MSEEKIISARVPVATHAAVKARAAMKNQKLADAYKEICEAGIASLAWGALWEDRAALMKQMFDNEDIEEFVIRLKKNAEELGDAIFIKGVDARNELTIMLKNNATIYKNLILDKQNSDFQEAFEENTASVIAFLRRNNLNVPACLENPQGIIR